MEFQKSADNLDKMKGEKWNRQGNGDGECERDVLYMCMCAFILWCVFNFSPPRGFHYILAGRAVCPL